MLRSLYTSASGMKAQELKIDVISNNLANVNTTAFKAQNANFQDLIYQTLVEPGALTSQNTVNASGIQVGLGVKPISVTKQYQQGDLVNTNNPLDVAIEGEGFFQITKPDGSIAYTRAGNFTLTQDGLLVTAEGYQIEPAITIPQNSESVTIGEDGTVSVRIPGANVPQQVGQIQAVRFPNRAGLKAVGKNLYLESGSSGNPIQGNFSAEGFGILAQGFIESSNVSVVTEVVNMITAQRAYEANSKGIQTADSMLSEAINVKR